MEGLEDKASGVEARMREGENWVGRNGVAEVKQVEIEGSGGVFGTQFWAAEIAFDGLECVQ